MKAAALALVLTSVGCVLAKTDGVLLRFERTGCFGTCPIYGIEVTGNGELRYKGRRFVKTVGSSHRRLSDAQIAALRDAFARARFAKLSEHCCNCYDMTDMPGTVITFVDHGTSKTVKVYHGCLAVPSAVKTLESDIDRIVEIEELIGTPEERRPSTR